MVVLSGMALGGAVGYGTLGCCRVWNFGVLSGRRLVVLSGMKFGGVVGYGA